MKEDKILSAESVLNNLIAELERVKKASEQLDDARKTVVTVTDASEKMTKGMNTLIDTANRVLKNIEEAKIREQYDEVEKELTEFTNKTQKIMGDISSMESTVSSGINAMKDDSESTRRTLSESTKGLIKDMVDIKSELVNVQRSNQSTFNSLKKTIVGLFSGVLVLQLLVLLMILLR
ncbi:MAG: hypothetical protein GXX80_14000 [Thermotogaceae bacterium]|nr:hypothetical protein [Thermotogaceae bacterium]